MTKPAPLKDKICIHNGERELDVYDPDDVKAACEYLKEQFHRRIEENNNHRDLHSSSLYDFEIEELIEEAFEDVYNEN